MQKENHPKVSQICNNGICSKGPKNEFEPGVVNEPPVFEPVKFHCIKCTYVTCAIIVSKLVPNPVMQRVYVLAIVAGGLLLSSVL